MCLFVWLPSEYLSTLRHNPGNPRHICFRSRHSHIFLFGFPFSRKITSSLPFFRLFNLKKKNSKIRIQAQQVQRNMSMKQRSCGAQRSFPFPCHLDIRTIFWAAGCRSCSGQARDHSCQRHRYTKSTKRFPDTTVNVRGASTQSNTLERNLNRPHVAPCVPRLWKHPVHVDSNLRICKPAWTVAHHRHVQSARS